MPGPAGAPTKRSHELILVRWRAVLATSHDDVSCVTRPLVFTAALASLASHPG